MQLSSKIQQLDNFSIMRNTGEILAPWLRESEWRYFYVSIEKVPQFGNTGKCTSQFLGDIRYSTIQKHTRVADCPEI